MKHGFPVMAILILALVSAATCRADVFWPKNYTDHSYLEPSASSNLPPSKVGSYMADNTIDGRKDTTWSEGAPGNGQGEWLQYDFSPEFTVSKLGIWNGYQKSAERFYQNGRVKSATIIYPDGSTQKIFLKDKTGVQFVNCKPVQVSHIRLVIDEVYPGAKWPDTCISEIDFYLEFNPIQ